MRDERDKKSLMRLDNRGSAMITAIVVGVVMMIFALSLLLLSYTLYAQTAKRTLQIECKYVAGETVLEMERELQDKDSQLYQELKAQLLTKDDLTGAYTGMWVPEGLITAEGTDTMSYKLKGSLGDDPLSDYDIQVDFILKNVGSSSDDEGNAAGSAVYDDTVTGKEEVPPGQWDEMAAGGMTAGGSYVVNVDVICSRGNESFEVSKDCNVDF